MSLIDSKTLYGEGWGRWEGGRWRVSIDPAAFIHLELEICREGEVPCQKELSSSNEELFPNPGNMDEFLALKVSVLFALMLLLLSFDLAFIAP